MFIYVTYKDAPELSMFLQRSTSSISDTAVEKTLLVNPNCPVRIMLEYIRNKCKLGIYTNFDLVDANGTVKGLFQMPTYAYATDLFEHKKTYYLVVLREDSERRLSVLPQLNHDNNLYNELKTRVTAFLQNGDESQTTITPPSRTTTLASKSTVKKK